MPEAEGVRLPDYVGKSSLHLFRQKIRGTFNMAKINEERCRQQYR